VSGDTSCADHDIAWRVRNKLGLDHLVGVGGVSKDPQTPGQHYLRHCPGNGQCQRFRPSEVHQYCRPVNATASAVIASFTR